MTNTFAELTDSELFKLYQKTHSFWMESAVLNEMWRRTINRYANSEWNEHRHTHGLKCDEVHRTINRDAEGAADPTVAYHCELPADHECFACINDAFFRGSQ